MKLLAAGIILLGMSTAFAEKVIKPGDTYSCQSVSESVSCSPETCSVKFHYVSKSYQVWTPNNKMFGKYKTKEDALTSADRLVGLKVCGKLVLDFDN